jgi:hypothetical protein
VPPREHGESWWKRHKRKPEGAIVASFKKILIPIDLSELETAKPAIERAVDLAHATNGNIR